MGRAFAGAFPGMGNTIFLFAIVSGAAREPVPPTNGLSARSRTGAIVPNAKKNGQPTLGPAAITC